MNEERHYDYMQRWGRHVATAQGINSVAVPGNVQRQKYKHRRDNMHLSIPRFTDFHSPRTTNHKAQVVQGRARISKSGKIQKHRMLRFPPAVSSYFARYSTGASKPKKIPMLRGTRFRAANAFFLFRSDQHGVSSHTSQSAPVPLPLSPQLCMSQTSPSATGPLKNKPGIIKHINAP